MFSLYKTLIHSPLLSMIISISYCVNFCKQFFITFFHAYCKNHHVSSFPFPLRLIHFTLSQISIKYFSVFLSNSETNLLLIISIAISVVRFMHQNYNTRRYVSGYCTPYLLLLYLTQFPYSCCAAQGIHVWQIVF